MTSKDPASETVDRRTVMAALSAGAGAALAGCLGGDGGDGSGPGGDGGTPAEELGERVPEIVIETMTGAPSASEIENVSMHIRDAIEERLGASATVTPKELVTLQSELAADSRDRHLHLDLEPGYPEYLDPYARLEQLTAEKAGDNAFIHNTQYASCEYSNAVVDLANAADFEEQQEYINEALSIASEDVERINFVNIVTTSAYRTDQIEVEELGAQGFNDRTPEVFWNAELVGDADDIIMNVSPGEFTDVAYHSSHYSMGWSHYPFSALTRYDSRTLELSESLAVDWEFSDEATTLTMDLREDATFHDGTPILAEDVQWNYQWLNDNAGAFGITEWDYESIEVADDHRIEFNFSEPSLPFLHFTSVYGILPPHQWQEAGAEENPTNPDIPYDNIIGSGPYEVRNFEPEALLDMEPYDDHWADANTSLVFQAFHDPESARRAFMQGEINVFQDLTGADQEVIESEIPDVAEVNVREDYSDWYIAPQTNFGPTKFREFRLALSYALDRDLMHEILQYGDSSSVTYSTILPENHPNFPENPDEVLTEISNGTAPDSERAQEILEEAGWGWDENGDLHYPPDADLEPRWPEGSGPAEHPDEFPCVEDLPP